jgi:hypothetical protein
MQTLSQVERPILFSGPMVMAILEGRKTQTRRVISPQNCHFGSGPRCMWEHGDFSKAWIDGKKSTCEYLHVPLPDKKIGSCKHLGLGGSVHRLWPLWWPKDAYCGPEKERPPYRLWVRETFAVLTPAYSVHDEYDEVEGRLDAAHESYSVVYAANQKNFPDRWRPAIHMPRWASRINLEITKVRVERVQDISEADAIAEGLTAQEGMEGANWPAGVFGYTGVNRGFFHVRNGQVCCCHDGNRLQLKPAVCAYRELWDSINAKRAGGKYAWAKNPWVWVIEFKRVMP